MASSSRLSEDEFQASYAAFFAPRTHKFDTVDFRLPATEQNLRSYFPSSSAERTSRRRIAGLLGLAIGAVFGLIGFGIDQLTRGLSIGLYRITEHVLRSASFAPAAVLFVALCLVLISVATCLVVFVAPLGAGSGIPELKSYLNGVRIPGFLAINSLFVKAVGIAFSIASGLICGKQGPVIHAAAITGAGMSQAASSRFRWRLDTKRLAFLRTEAWKRDFTAVGAAVGVAVAFGSPMGAWMWVYEEACTHWSWELGIITLGGCLMGSVVVRILNFIAQGQPGGGFGFFTLTQFGKLVTPFDGTTFLLKDVPAYIVVGVLGGLCGAILPLVNKRITLFRYKRVAQPVRRIFETLFIAFLTAVIRVVVPFLVNDCTDVNPELQGVWAIAPLQDWSRFTCDENQFSPWAAVIYNPTDTVVRGLLFAKGTEGKDILFPSGALAFGFVYYFAFTVWTYGVAAPAGVFFPGFLFGSVYGRLIGNAVHAIFPGRVDLSLTGFAFIGAVSALAGLTRTISVAVIALEATGGNNASFTAVLVALIAKLVGDFLYTRGIYDLHIGLKGIPFLMNAVPKLEKYQKVRVADVMESNVIGVRRLSSLGGLAHMLETNGHHAFPVFSKRLRGHRKQEQHDSLSRTTMLEGELSRNEHGALDNVTSRIFMHSRRGLQATIFDGFDGSAKQFKLSPRGDARRAEEPISSSAPPPPDADDGPAGLSLVPLQSLDHENEDVGKRRDAPNFELMGTIDRGTLLAVVEHECSRGGTVASPGNVATSELERKRLDSAWPNASRLKGDEEARIVRRVSELNLADRVIDLKRYIDPDPLLMSDRALSAAAYKLFRGTGARHILVTNMRSGRVCGIMTRKDILLESIQQVLSEKKALTDVETVK